MQDSALLILMAKAPVAGAVKTRMSPPLSPPAAAELAQTMFAQTLSRARSAWPGEVQVCASPHAAHPFFAAVAKKHGLQVTTQAPGDLGARMTGALHAGITHAGCAAVMGCDVPHVPGAVLTRAHELLTRGENVIAPAADGGFYLLGLQYAPANLFNGVDWNGTAQLMQVQTNAHAAGVTFRRLQTMRDIDRYHDLQWLAAKDSSYQKFLQHKTEVTVTGNAAGDTVNNKTVAADAI